MTIAKPYTILSTQGELIPAKIIRGYVALYISTEYWILAKGYHLYKYYHDNDKLEYFSKLNDTKAALLSLNRLTRRLFRAEITRLYKFGNDWFCIARKAIYKYDSPTKMFEICHHIDRGSRPMNLCQDKNGTIYYGEYFFNPTRKSVNIMASKDNGETWQIAYTFDDGEINHIHGLFNDKNSNRMWVFTGDDDAACIAGYTTDGFRTFHREFEGKQQYRICVPLFFENTIVYPTDSQFAQNSIRQIDRRTKEIQNLQKIQGSGIYALDAGNVLAVSTTVEPSKVNTDQSSHLWYSFDEKKWRELLSFEKDIWKTTLFQFGSIRFPNYESPSDKLVITGRAIKTLDQSTLIIPINYLP